MMRQAHRISGRIQSCQTFAIVNRQETISNHIYCEAREFEGFGAWTTRACGCTDMDFDGARSKAFESHILISYIDR